ncbi:MAG TPA: terminase TerL endonuclease subunit [Tepidisphaeraceae bacterium]|nr:terminase TerL endonuclease subunit [Tepidisphaeraceae bacterium]
MPGVLELKEDAEFYFDAEAADRPIRFAQKFLRHYEGQWAGLPFDLLDWQKENVIRPLFGWKRRADGRRRFKELWLLTAKGAGKTPLLALCGMYCLLADHEPGAHVISSATDFQQAYLTLDAGKKFVAAHAALKKACDPKQFEIRAPNNSKWTVLSGTAEGRHGFRPSVLLMDEAHEWPNGKLYDTLTANMTKRRQPLTLVTTNAGSNHCSFAWQLHKRAVAVLEGKSQDKSLLPVIYAADEAMDWTSEAAAKAANPSLGTIITFEDLKKELDKGRDSDDGESRYRRLFLSQWLTRGDGPWLDMLIWDESQSATSDPTPDGCEVYIGMDLAQSDDLCGVVTVGVTAERFYVKSKFWMPRKTAKRYEEKNAVPYAAWATAGHIVLLDEDTISSAVRQEIAQHIITIGKSNKIKAVCYDTYRADETVAMLEAARITCVTVPQGFTTSPGCFELDRRLKERSIVVEPNDVLRFCAENAQIETNSYGAIRVIKPNAKEKYAGTRGKKVDGISALVTALTEARKHAFPIAKKKVQVFAT